MLAGLAWICLGTARDTVGDPWPSIPRPSMAKLDWSKPIAFDSWKPQTRDRLSYRVRFEFARRFAGAKSGMSLSLKTKPSGQGFRIVLTRSDVTVEAGESFAAAASFLAGMARVRNGHLVLPSGTIECRPATKWRGVHLFVGPEALPFHKRLWTNVLLPLGYNKVVLQCERTEWACLPNVRGGINMKRSDLAKLCDWYRSVGVEPIPLVQSFGHAEWLFQGKANLDLAMDRDVPYAVDPRKPGVPILFRKLWDEVLAVTKAKTIHFGLDEVDLKGFPKDPALVTKLWKIQLPMLAKIARRHKVGMMLWGDECLAPGQAPDATNAPTIEIAADRRSVIPKGAFIADWHYRRDPTPELFAPSLALWAKEGYRPIAATWYKPENIRGFILGAKGNGVLQTTWAGYESNEKNMLRSMNQFNAMVLAADYAWSGRKEMPDRLGYDPGAVFRRMMYADPISLK